MNIRTIVALAAALLLTGAGVALAGPDMHPGQWQMTLQTEMPGMPFPIPPMKYKICMSAQETVPQKEKPGQECKMVQTHTSGNTVSWVIECQDKDSHTHSEGKITYHHDSMAGTIHSRMKSKKEGTMEVNQKISGKRLGPCPK